MVEHTYFTQAWSTVRGRKVGGRTGEEERRKRRKEGRESSTREKRI